MHLGVGFTKQRSREEEAARAELNSPQRKTMEMRVFSYNVRSIAGLSREAYN